MGPGPYLYLPIVGPGTFRDVVGWVGDAFTQPLVLNWLNEDQIEQIDLRHRKKVTFFTRTFTLTPYGEAAFIVGGLDKRARADGELKALKETSVDPYAALRSSYLQNRAGEIAQLKAPGPGTDAAGDDAVSSAALPAFDDPLADPAAAKPSPKPVPSGTTP